MAEQPQYLSLQALQDETGGRFTAEHVCPENYGRGGLRILYCSDEDGLPQNNWQFYSLRFANDSDIKTGVAEKIGEIISLSMCVIHYCPFCGQKLETHGQPLNA